MTPSELAIQHVDETGTPCTRHSTASSAMLLQLAMVGSRAPAFHHDCASKLQGLVMALDEISELTENGDPHVARAVEAAMDASRELNALLNLNRALTKPAPRAAIALRTLLSDAAARVAVGLQGELPDATVTVTGPPMTHALALLVDVAAGTGRGRKLVLGAAAAGRDIELAFPTSPAQPGNASELIAIATFVVTRDGGKLWCDSAGDRIFVRLPG